MAVVRAASAQARQRASSSNRGPPTKDTHGRYEDGRQTSVPTNAKSDTGTSVPTNAKPAAKTSAKPSAATNAKTSANAIEGATETVIERNQDATRHVAALAEDATKTLAELAEKAKATQKQQSLAAIDSYEQAVLSIVDSYENVLPEPTTGLPNFADMTREFTAAYTAAARQLVG